MAGVSGQGDGLPSNITATGVEVNVSAPGKVILHGEHSVVYGKLALAASLGLRTNVRIVEISAPNIVVVELPLLNFSYTYDLQKLKQHLLDQPLPLLQAPSDFSWERPELVHHGSLSDLAESFIGYTTGTNSLTSSQQMSLKSMFYLMAGILGSIDVDVTSFSLTCNTQLTIGAGTGSSASFLVSFAGALVQYVKRKRRNSVNVSKAPYMYCQWDFNVGAFSTRELELICNWAFCAEKIIHGTPSGIDNTICTYGSMVEFRKGLAPKLLENHWPFKMLLINSNVSRETKKMVSRTARLHERYPDLVNSILNAMEDVAFMALQYISSICPLAGEQYQIDGGVREVFEELGRLASINHNLLSALGVSHLKLDEIIHVLAENGLHGKLTGAGGGGYAICLLPPNIEEGVVQKVTQILVSSGFDVAFTSLGGVGVKVD